MQATAIVTTLKNIIDAIETNTAETVVSGAIDASIDLGDVVEAAFRVDEEIVIDRLLALAHPSAVMSRYHKLDESLRKEIFSGSLDLLEVEKTVELLEENHISTLTDEDRSRLARLERFENLAREAAVLQAEVVAGISPEAAEAVMAATVSMMQSGGND